jgi:glutaredoxin
LVAAQVNIKLYGNPFCHLCEEAEAILDKAGITAIKIDIVEDEKLFEQYSLRIPVLQRIDNDAELAWPFDAAAVSRFLK